jgi:hypothetical protein
LYHIKRMTLAKGAREQGAEEDIRRKKGEGEKF